MNRELSEVEPEPRELAKGDHGASAGRSHDPRVDGQAVQRRGEIAPHWFELLALAGVVSLGAVGSVGLLLAVAGHFSTVAALSIGLPLTAVALPVLHRDLPPGGTSRAAQVGAAVAVLLAIGYGAFAGLTPSQNVVLTRDPGSYASTGRWLARSGTLEVNARNGAFDGISGLKFAGAAVYDVGKVPPPATGPPIGEVRESGRLQLQFNHLASVAFAVGFDVGGYQLMFRVPALLSALTLLTLYAVAARVTRRPYASLLAPALLAASMPFLYVARNTYSESAASVLLWGAVLVLIGVHNRPRVGAATIGGALLGALVCARVDALLYVCMVFPLAAVSLATSKNPTVRKRRLLAWGAAIVAVGVTGVIGWFDLVERSGSYAHDLAPQLSVLRKGLAGAAAASLVGLLVWTFAAPIRRFAVRVRRPVAVAASVLVAGAILFGWFVRPHLKPAETSLRLETVETLQRRDGLRVEPARSYAEESLRWMAWYLGAPALVAATGGLAWATWRAVRAWTDAATLTLLVLCLGAGALYWYDPNITPDQMWATRRFIPATFPSLAVWAAASVGFLMSTTAAQRVRCKRPPLAVAALGLATIALLLPPVLTTAPLRWQRTQPGYLRPILQTCDAVGSDGAIIVLGGFGSITLPQTLRSWCGVPVAAQGSAVSPAKLPALAARIKAAGRHLYLVSPDVKDLDGVRTPGGPQPTSTVAVVQESMAEQTLDRPPSHYVDPDDVLAEPVPTPFALHVLDADPR